MTTEQHEVSKMHVRIALGHLSAAMVALCDAGEYDALIGLCEAGIALQQGYDLSPRDVIRPFNPEEV